MTAQSHLERDPSLATGTTFGAANTFADDMNFSAGAHTFSVAQEFTKGSSFGENQSFGAGVGHNFFKDDMAFLAGTDFGCSQNIW